MRKTPEEIKELKERNNVDRVWSYSRINTFCTSPFEYLLKYILHAKEDRQDCIYTSTGTLCHDILDKYYEGKIKYEDMTSEFEDGWLVSRDIAGLKFDRNDEEKDIKIQDKYYSNLSHFFKHNTPIEYKVAIEPFVSVWVDKNLFIGYIDAIYKDNDDCYNIIDFKSSSIYKGKVLEEHSAQLVLYAMSLIQKGVPLEKIKCCFNFLKYCTIQYQQANGTIKTRDVERCEIGNALQSNLKVWIKKLGYSDRADELLKKVIDTNGIECLPEDLQAMYKISDCYVYIPLNQKLIDYWTNSISTTIKDIETRENDYAKLKEQGENTDICNKIFWDTDESVKSQSYYFSTLCGYSANLHLPYKKYLDELDKQNGSVFEGVGVDAEDIENESFVISNALKNSNDNNDDIDLSWLDEII